MYVCRIVKHQISQLDSLVVLFIHFTEQRTNIRLPGCQMLLTAYRAELNADERTAIANANKKQTKNKKTKKTGNENAQRRQKAPAQPTRVVQESLR